VLLRKELVQLRNLLAAVVRRERTRSDFPAMDTLLARAELARSGLRAGPYLRQLAAGEGDGVTLPKPVVGAASASGAASDVAPVPGWEFSLAGSITLPPSGLNLPRDLLIGAAFGPPPLHALAAPPPGIIAGPLVVRRPEKAARRPARPGAGMSRARGPHVTAAATAARKASAAANASRRAAAAAGKAAGGGGERGGRDGGRDGSSRRRGAGVRPAGSTVSGVASGRQATLMLMEPTLTHTDKRFIPLQGGDWGGEGSSRHYSPRTSDEMAQAAGKQHRELPGMVVEKGELRGSSTIGGEGGDGR